MPPPPKMFGCIHEHGCLKPKAKKLSLMLLAPGRINGGVNYLQPDTFICTVGKCSSWRQELRAMTRGTREGCGQLAVISPCQMRRGWFQPWNESWQPSDHSSHGNRLTAKTSNLSPLPQVQSPSLNPQLCSRPSAAASLPLCSLLQRNRTPPYPLPSPHLLLYPSPQIHSHSLGPSGQLGQWRLGLTSAFCLTHSIPQCHPQTTCFSFFSLSALIHRGLSRSC